MGRSRSYEEEAVLNGAMHAFRRKGYHAVSIRDLEDATGLKAGSIYHSFGDKAGLFDAAYAHYNRVVLRRRVEQYAPLEAGIDGLRALFLSLLNEPNDESFGCLITNSAVELGGDEPPHRCTVDGFEVLIKAFTERLLLTPRRRTLDANSKTYTAASRLLALYQGILVLVRAGYDKQALKGLIREEFNQLEAKYET